MTANQNHATLNVFVYGEQEIDGGFHLGDMEPFGGYGVLGIPGEVCDLTLFIHTPEQARAIAAAAAAIAAQFPGAEPEPAPHLASCGHPSNDDGECGCAYWPERAPAEPEPAHECGTPAEGTPDLNTYPARMAVLQRDLNDPESWIFRCGEDHASDAPGWQSPDYASQDDALIAARDHARGVHDMGLPAELAELAAAAERAFSGQ